MKRSTELKQGTKGLKSSATLKTTAPLKASKKPITGVSQRTAKDDADFARLRPTILERDHFRCGFVAPIGASNWEREHDIWRHVHHLLPRARGGLSVPSNLTTLCSKHHRWIHDHPEWSEENGWLLTSADESDILES
jgi:5-methylcytosine-specific restriction endonuclease McrA